MARAARVLGFLVALLFAVGGWLGLWVSRRLAADERIRLGAELAAARAQVGTACDTIYGAWWIEHRCGGVLGGFMPPGLAAIACPQTIQVYRSGRKEDVLARVAGLGPGRTLLTLEERGARERAFPIYWRPEPH